MSHTFPSGPLSEGPWLPAGRRCGQGGWVRLWASKWRTRSGLLQALATLATRSAEAQAGQEGTTRPQTQGGDGGGRGATWFPLLASFQHLNTATVR